MSRRHTVFTCIPALLLAACAADVPEGHSLDRATAPLICGGAAPSWIDVELYHGTLGLDKTSEPFVDHHERQVGMFKWQNNFRARYPAPASPGTWANNSGFCSGTLISQNLFLTAGHCVDDDPGNPIDPGQVNPINGRTAAIRDQDVAFNFQNDPSGAVRASDDYDIVSVREWRQGGFDYAILELGASLTTGKLPGDVYGWARVAAVTPQPGDDLTIIQHPSGIPKVIDSGTVTNTNVGGIGEITYDNIDSLGGASGSGILDWQGRLIGVHTMGPVGACAPGNGNGGWLIEDILPHSPLLGGLLREVGDHSEVLAAGDFNKDGYNDVVVGVPGRSIPAVISGDMYGAGAVRVIYGDAAGPDVGREQWLDQNTLGVDGIAEAADFFGAAVTVGDFNADLYADLAVGAPGEDSVDTGARNSGGVWVFYGGAGGLSGNRSASFDQEDANITEVSENHDRMGSALSAGDFNKDGFADLAVGTPGENSAGNAASGMVTVLYGSAAGIVSAGNQQFDQVSAIGAAESEAGDRFGSSLASGDFDKDGTRDLAIGTPYEDLSNPLVIDAGSISVLYGSVTKLKVRANSRFYQGTTGGLEGVLERGDRLGVSLASGDLNGDGNSDLVAGAPGEDIGTYMHAGFVHAIYGTTNTGLTAVGDVGLSEDSASVPGNPEAEDRLGMSLSVAQLNAFSALNRAVDVLVGAPGEIIGGVDNAGMVIELFGRQGAVLNGTGSVAFHQNTPNVAGDAETGDRFGTVVLARDLTLDGYAEALFSLTGEDINIPPVAAPQAFQLLFGTGNGLTTTGNLLFP